VYFPESLCERGLTKVGKPDGPDLGVNFSVHLLKLKLSEFAYQNVVI